MNQQPTIRQKIMIIHLDKEQVRQERRRLLSDDVFVIFHDALRQFCREGYTMLSPAEIYLSAKSFASDVLLLPDILEGIEDEMDDIQDDAANEDEAMLVLMVASAVISQLARPMSIWMSKPSL